MTKIRVTKARARQFLLAYQHLLPPHNLEGKEGILQYLKKVGCIQYDPLDIVGKNAELTLQSRIANFNRTTLNDLLYKDRLLIDGWDKMMSIYRVEDWPYFSRLRAIREEQVKWVLGRRNSLEALDYTSQIRQQIEEKGALPSSKFQFGSANPGKWGHSKLASAALDYMFHKGELGIERKIGTQKVYNTIERLVPETIYKTPDPFDTEEDFFRWHYLRRIGSVGMVRSKRSDVWASYVLEDNDRKDGIMKRLLREDLISECEVEGIESPYFVRKEDELDLRRDTPREETPRAIILAPLDNLLWDRALIRELFDFQYSWEVYLPAHKRKYGYYVLPILYGDRFVARFEPARDKNKETLIINNWWWEKNASISKPMKDSIITCMRDFMTFLGARKLQTGALCQERVRWLQV